MGIVAAELKKRRNFPRESDGLRSKGRDGTLIVGGKFALCSWTPPPDVGFAPQSGGASFFFICLVRRIMIAGSNELAVLNQASRILAEATSLDEIKTIRDKAEAARNYVKAAKLGLELQNHAAEVKLRAERKAGSVLKTLRLRGGDRKSKGHRDSLKLDDLGISRNQSKRWQQIAAVPDVEFNQYLKGMNSDGREITSAGLLRIASKHVPTVRSGARSSLASTISVVADGNPNHDAIDELKNHCQLLADVLRPIYETPVGELKRGEKRIIGRLLAEMTILIAQLAKTLPKIGR